MSNLNNLTIEEQQHQAQLDAELDAWESLVVKKPEDYKEKEETDQQQILKKYQNLSEKRMKELIFKPL